jgi:hypothetical protein
MNVVWLSLFEVAVEYAVVVEEPLVPTVDAYPCGQAAPLSPGSAIVVAATRMDADLSEA